MTYTESSAFETQQLSQIVDLYSVESDAWYLPLDGQASGWSISLADAILYSTPVDQANSGITLGVEDPHVSLSDFSPSSIDFLFPSVLPAQDSGPSICSSPENWNIELLAHDDSMIDHVPQASNEVHASCISSTLEPVPTSCTNDASPQTLYVNQITQESFQGAGSSTTPSAETPQRYLGGDQPATSLSPSLADSATWFDSLSCLEEVFQNANFEVFGQQHIPFDGPLCRWRSGCGAICGCEVTRESIPEHLSEHGIKKKSRNFPTKCNWDGCRRKTPMNRESIVRHIREVHLRLKRPSKRVLERHIQRNFSFP